MSEVTLHLGDCLDVLSGMADNSVHCCVTSPPYWGLRDYGFDGQIGLEKTPEEYVARLVAVFREVRRVLREDGTCWVNLGDSYAASSNTGGLKHKDLVGIPWRVAFALQADGWYLRQDIIWHKPNPMPESVTDRCTKAHEYIFLLTKSARYWYDADAVKEAAIHSGRLVKATGGESKNRNAGFGSDTKLGFTKHDTLVSDTRNRRSVWTVATKPYKGAHFATFPPKLIEPCILAGCPVGGTVLDPFGGSGTTAEVAILNDRNAVLIEANPEYAELAEARIAAAQAAPAQEALL